MVVALETSILLHCLSASVLCIYMFCVGDYVRLTQPSIPRGSVNEDQLRLGRKRQVWFIGLADERGVCR